MINTACLSHRRSTVPPSIWHSGFKETNASSPLTRKYSVLWESLWPTGSLLGLRPPGLDFKSCVWRTMPTDSAHHPQEILQVQLSLHVHKGGLKHHSCINSLIHLFIHLFTLSFIYSFIHLFIYSFIHLFIYSFIHFLLIYLFYSFIHLFIYSFIHLFIYSFIHLFIYSFIHLFIYSFIHLFIYSFIHLFVI